MAHEFGDIPGAESATRVLIEMVQDSGISFTHQLLPDDRHKVTLVDGESGHTQVVVHADLYTALCEAATACGFDLEDGSSP